MFCSLLSDTITFKWCEKTSFLWRIEFRDIGSGGCGLCNYPTFEFASYTECDDYYVRKRIDQIAPGLNLTPPWTTDDFKSNRYGNDRSDCPLPCKTFSTEVKFVSETDEYLDHQGHSSCLGFNQQGIFTPVLKY